MSDKTKCPDCGDKHTCIQCEFDNIGDPYSSGTGEVESFWTREAPKEPKKTSLWLILMGDALNNSNVWLGPEDRMYWKGEQGFEGYIKYIIEAYSVKYWSREPIRFPDAPREDQGDE